MNALFAKEVSIRLAEDGKKFVCTTKYGRFFSRTTEVSLNCQPAPDTVDDNAVVPLKKRLTYGSMYGFSADE